MRHRLEDGLLLIDKIGFQWRGLTQQTWGRARLLPLCTVALIIALGLAVTVVLNSRGDGSDARAAQLISVQSGTTTMTQGGGASQTVNVAITSVDTTRSILFFNLRGDSTEPRNGQVRGQLTSATNIQFLREDDNASASAITIEWYVAEFASGVSVQRGTFTSVLDSAAGVTITAVDPATSFVMISGSAPSTDTTYDGFYRATEVVRRGTGQAEPTTRMEYNKVHNEVKRTVLAELVGAGGDRDTLTFYDDLHRPTVTVLDFDGDGRNAAEGGTLVVYDTSEFVNDAESFTGHDAQDFVTRE